jgi:hypothetical protein
VAVEVDPALLLSGDDIIEANVALDPATSMEFGGLCTVDGPVGAAGGPPRDGVEGGAAADGAPVCLREGEGKGTRIFLTALEDMGDWEFLRLAFVAAASLTASDLETSCAAAQAMASLTLLDLGVVFMMKEPSLGLSFLFLLSFPMVVVSGTLGLKVLRLLGERMGRKF